MSKKKNFSEPCGSCKKLVWTVEARWDPATGVIIRTFTKHCEHKNECKPTGCEHYRPQEKHAAIQ